MTSTLDTILAERYPSLSAKQQAVAALLSRDPAFVALASAAEVAARAGVDTATVVRTCQSLGYSGWRELHEEVKAAMAGRRTFAQRVADLEAVGDGDVVGRVFGVACENVTSTLRRLDGEQFEATARAVAGAGQVVVAAGGVSQGPGVFLTSSLQIIGLPAVLSVGAGDTATALAPLGRGDVVLAISLWRYLRPTVQALEHARRIDGVRTVAITDSAVAPAALIAEHALVAETATAGPRMGLTGVHALVEALVAKVALLAPERSRAATRIADRLYFDDNVLGAPTPGADGARAGGPP